MICKLRRIGINVKLIFLFIPVLFLQCNKDEGERNVGWEVYKSDFASTSHSELDLINRDNVDSLTIAWKFNFPVKEGQKRRGMLSENNPIIIDSVMYVTSGDIKLYAIHAVSGDLIWKFDPEEECDISVPGGISRGVAFWEDQGEKRILFTASHFLIAVDATTGKPVKDFGDDGKVDLNVGLRDDPDEIHADVTSPGIVYKNLIIMGTNSPDSYRGFPGYERAYDVRSGELVWTFHTIPRPGEEGYDTWPKDAWRYAGGVNDWAGMSLDEDRGLVFLALGSPSYDFYGGDRKGKNLFANSIVALKAETGELVWYYQTVHHDLWDLDLPAPPNLVSVEKDGKKIDAVAQVTKTGFIFILDRESGEPIFPIEERAVPASDVPGEEAWPTQPYPSYPSIFSKQTLTEEDIIDFGNPNGSDSLRKVFNELRYEGMFTPPSLKGTFAFPSTTGGAEWGGGAYDAETGMLYVVGNNGPEIIKLGKDTLMAERNNSLSSVEMGKEVYDKFCAACHGDSREGLGGYPPLDNLKGNLNIERALSQIRNGGGKMPPFDNLIEGEDEVYLLQYLYDIKNVEEDEMVSAEERGFMKELISSSEMDQNEKSIDTFPTIPYRNVTAYRKFGGANGYIGIDPPWSELNAIDLNSGELIWSTPIGNFPELEYEDGKVETGTEVRAGPIVTKGGLVFIAGSGDNKFRCFDKLTGELLWETNLTGKGNAIPSTYSYNGRQFVVISVSPSEAAPRGGVEVFSLPQ